jgi:hypothetical protein
MMKKYSLLKYIFLFRLFMINISSLDQDTISEIESFSTFTQRDVKNNKNGNSLRMGLELKMFKIAGEDEFKERYPYISEKIEQILHNIKVRKH